MNKIPVTIAFSAMFMAMPKSAQPYAGMGWGMLKLTSTTLILPIGHVKMLIQV